MALPYVIDATQRVAFVTMSGRITGAAIGHTVSAIYRDPDWHCGFDVVWDGSLISELLLESDDFRRGVALQRSFGELAGGGHDIIITTRAIDEAAAQMYVVLVKRVRPTFLVRSQPEAAALLGHHDTKRA